MNPVRTVIVDDERYACERLKKLLKPFSQIELLDYSTNSREAVSYIMKTKPDLVFLDIELENNISGFDIIEKLGEDLYLPHIILVTAHTQYSIKAIKHQVFDYLVKPVDVDELEDTLDRLFSSISASPLKLIKKFGTLSERERLVLKYVLEGKTSEEIAEQLYISINTVHTHRRNILKKTGTKSVIELINLSNNPND
jgi:two-component system LytT family response regulator